MAEPATTGALNEQQVLLSTLPPSRGQQRLALATILVLLAAFCATVPFAAVPVGYIREFIPAYAAAMFVISSITSALLFVQFSVVQSRALLRDNRVREQSRGARARSRLQTSGARRES